jgi:hypothetical protein
MGFIGCILLLLVFENEQQISQIFDSGNTNVFEVLASKEEEEEDSLEAKICNKLFDSETCEKIEVDTPVEDKELTEEEIKAEAIINRYLEPVESETIPIDNTIDNEVETASGSNNTSIGSTKPFR